MFALKHLKTIGPIFRVIKKYRITSFVILLLGVCYWLWLPPVLFTDKYSSVLTDENGNLLSAKIASDGQWRFPQSQDVPEKFKQCIVTFEDVYFYYHPGVNPASLFNSLKSNLGARKIKRGGSTITMQIARMMRHNRPRNYYQKLVEVLMALRIELSYKKSSILNAYCSHAPFGGNVVGLAAASWRYFGRSPEQLSWAESAVLAVLPNAPALIYPGKNQSLLLKKRNRLLKKLKDKNVIDANSYKLAIAEPLPQKSFAIPQVSSHLLDLCVRKNGGAKIYQTSLDIDLQKQVNALFNSHMQTLAGNQVFNAAALIIETNTGDIKAYVGNSFANNNDHENYVDMVQAPRSTGSILKPFLYAFMLSDNKILPKSLIEDVPTQIGAYGPKNFNLGYDGLVPANQALARSLNVPAVKMLQSYGPAKFHERLKQLGFTTFKKSTTHYGLSLILGGGEATLFELASAYSGMGRALMNYSNPLKSYLTGSYREASYLKNDSQKIATNRTKSDLISASAIYYTFEAMTELLRPQEYTGWAQFVSKQRIAWKTGTSFGFRDAWAVGLNPKYTVAIWVGNADGEGRPELTGSSAAAPLLFSIFNLLPKSDWFNKPTSDMATIGVCRESGFKASEFCTHVEEKNYPLGAEKTKICPFHKQLFLDESGNYRVSGNCYPVHKMQKVSWFVASPLQEFYFKQHSLIYKTLPPYLALCAGEQGLSQLEIVYPREGFKIYVPVDHNEDRSRVIFKATHKKNDALLFWYLDGEYLGKTDKYHQLSALPNKGFHQLYITDQAGEIAVCRFEVIEK
jgi:penicillin-binding protein 1C